MVLFCILVLTRDLLALLLLKVILHLFALNAHLKDLSLITILIDVLIPTIENLDAFTLLMILILKMFLSVFSHVIIHLTNFVNGLFLANAKLAIRSISFENLIFFIHMLTISMSID